MSAERKEVRTNRGPMEYTCLGCPLTRNRSAWCFRLCAPDEQGNGRCGRVAPHGLRGRTQLSIERHGELRLAAHCEKLERMYLAAPCNEYYDPGVRISAGEAEIMIPIQEKFLRVSNEVHTSVCFTALADAAVLPGPQAGLRSRIIARKSRQRPVVSRCSSAAGRTAR